MIRYSFAALALKFFSFNKLTKKAYRKLGNILGQKIRKRTKIDTYIKRGNLLLSLCKKYHVINENDKLLEIGTGWIHWYSIYLRLFHNVHITMFDIWDNRQLSALKAAFFKLGESFKDETEQKFLRNIDLIVNAESFEELYEQFNLDYVIEAKGSLRQFPTNSIDLIFSFHVLEHVPKDSTNELVNNIYRILKPGGFSLHQIGIDDHLQHYDKRESPMNYLRYSDTTWKIFFENEVQYFNRLLMSDWLNIFGQVGFVLMEKIPNITNINSLKIHPKYQQYTKEDLSCSHLTIVHKKPN